MWWLFFQIIGWFTAFFSIPKRNSPYVLIFRSSKLLHLSWFVRYMICEVFLLVFSTLPCFQLLIPCNSCRRPSTCLNAFHHLITTPINECLSPNVWSTSPLLFSSIWQLIHYAFPAPYFGGLSNALLSVSFTISFEFHTRITLCFDKSFFQAEFLTRE